MAARVANALLCCFAVFGTLIHASTALADASPQPPSAYRVAARAAGVPATILFGVALQETGTPFNGRLLPWPWTLNVAGTAHRYDNRVDACTALKQALQRVPANRVDAGLGQINVGFHGHRVEQPCVLLDPYRNLAIAATILREQHTPGADWWAAIGRYHRPAGGEPAARYRRSVEQHLVRAFGTATVVATTGDSKR